MLSLFAGARECLEACDPDEKLALTRHYAHAWREGNLALTAAAPPPEPVALPGRPARPELVHPSQVVKRRLASRAGRAAFLHALAHIEFNAINLAWDAVYRFRDLPRAFYNDWVRVAGEEALHFGILRERLRDAGYEYGDFPAHDGLWDVAVRTACDVLPRMALVPRVLEARGLDVTPGMIARLRQVGDSGSAAVLEIILRDEIGHVAAGSRWFRHVCRQRGLDPLNSFQQLLHEYLPGRIREPLNVEARSQAGFDNEELALLRTIANRN